MTRATLQRLDRVAQAVAERHVGQPLPDLLVDPLVEAAAAGGEVHPDPPAVQVVAAAVDQVVLDEVVDQPGRVPYVYTALYEGGEHTEGVFLTSETPDTQLFPAMRLLARERSARRWFVVGNDYVWPRRTARAAHRYAARHGLHQLPARSVQALTV